MGRGMFMRSFYHADDIPIGDLDCTVPSLTGIGGKPYEGTYLIARHKDRVLTPMGWMDIDELEDFESPKFW